MLRVQRVGGYYRYRWGLGLKIFCMVILAAGIELKNVLNFNQMAKGETKYLRDTAASWNKHTLFRNAFLLQMSSNVSKSFISGIGCYSLFDIVKCHDTSRGQLFKHQPDKMAKHTETIHRLLSTKLFECV